MSDEPRGERSPFNVWWAVAGGFLAAVIVALVLVLVLGQGSKNNDANKGNSGGGGGTTETVPPASSPASSNSDAGCNLPAGSQSIPTTGPSAQWKTDVYLLVPSSTTYGPTTVSGSKWGCFAHSPTGALFAAAHVIAGIGGSDYATFIRAAGVDNSARQEWIAEQDPTAHTQAPGQVAQFTGFQFQSVQANAVVVTMAMSQENVTASMKVSLVWDTTSQTWKVDLATSSLSYVKANAGDFTAWEATNG